MGEVVIGAVIERTAILWGADQHIGQRVSIKDGAGRVGLSNSSCGQNSSERPCGVSHNADPFYVDASPEERRQRISNRSQVANAIGSDRLGSLTHAWRGPSVQAWEHTKAGLVVDEVCTRIILIIAGMPRRSNDIAMAGQMLESGDVVQRRTTGAVRENHHGKCPTSCPDLDILLRYARGNLPGERVPSRWNQGHAEKARPVNRYRRRIKTLRICGVPNLNINGTPLADAAGQNDLDPCVANPKLAALIRFIGC